MSLFRHIHSFTASLKWDVFCHVCWTEVSSGGGALQRELSSSSELLRTTSHHLTMAFSLLKSGSLPLVPVAISITSVQYPTLLLRPVMNLTNTAPLMTLFYREASLFTSQDETSRFSWWSVTSDFLSLNEKNQHCHWLIGFRGWGAGINKKNSFLKRKKGVSDHDIIHCQPGSQVKSFFQRTPRAPQGSQPVRLLALSWFPSHSLFYGWFLFLRPSYLGLHLSYLILPCSPTSSLGLLSYLLLS